MECGVKGGAERIHFGSIVDVGSSSIFAPFLVPFIEFSVLLWCVMHSLYCFYLRFRGNKLGLEGILKGLPRSIIRRVGCKRGGNAIASPIPSLGSLFKIGQG